MTIGELKDLTIYMLKDNKIETDRSSNKKVFYKYWTSKIYNSILTSQYFNM